MPALVRWSNPEASNETISRALSVRNSIPEFHRRAMHLQAKPPAAEVPSLGSASTTGP